MHRDLPSPEAIAVADGLRLFYSALDPREPLVVDLAKSRALYRPLNVILPELLDDAGVAASIAENVEALRRWRKTTLDEMRRASRALEEKAPELLGRVLDFEAACDQADIEFQWTGPRFVAVGDGKRPRFRYRPTDVGAWAGIAARHPARGLVSDSADVRS